MITWFKRQLVLEGEVLFSSASMSPRPGLLVEPCRVPETRTGMVRVRRAGPGSEKGQPKASREAQGVPLGRVGGLGGPQRGEVALALFVPTETRPKVAGIVSPLAEPCGS